MSSPEAIYPGADTLIEWNKMTDERDGTYINDAVVTFTLKDKVTGSVMANATAISMPYVAASNGKYQGILQDTVALVRGSFYWLEITATSGGNTGFRRILCRAQDRGSY